VEVAGRRPPGSRHPSILWHLAPIRTFITAVPEKPKEILEETKEDHMRNLTVTVIALAAILATGVLSPTNRAEAMVGTPGSAAALATEKIAPVENVSWWCGWRCHRIHRLHRVFAFEDRFYFRHHHRPYFFEPRCRWC
jgi:hypothetical protein